MTTLAHVKTQPIENRKDILEASKLSKNYCAYTVRQLDIERLLNSDRWSYGELLTDLYINPKVKDDPGIRETVGFVMFMELVDKNNSKLLGIRYFAMAPWYNHITCVQWVKHCISGIMAEDKEFVAVSWPVDERDTDLQQALKVEGYRAVKLFEAGSKLLFNTVKDETVTRIIFTQ